MTSGRLDVKRRLSKRWNHGLCNYLKTLDSMVPKARNHRLAAGTPSMQLESRNSSKAMDPCRRHPPERTTRSGSHSEPCSDDRRKLWALDSTSRSARASSRNEVFRYHWHATLRSDRSVHRSRSTIAHPKILQSGKGATIHRTRGHRALRHPGAPTERSWHDSSTPRGICLQSSLLWRNELWLSRCYICFLRGSR